MAGPPPGAACAGGLRERLEVLLLFEQGTHEGQLGLELDVVDARRVEHRQPVHQLAGARALAEPGQRAQLEEDLQRLVDETLLQGRVVHPDDALHQLGVGEVDEVKHAAAEERVRELLLVVAGDDHHRTLGGDDLRLGLHHPEPHPVQLVEQVVGELEVRLVHLVDEQHHPGPRAERLPQRAPADVVADVLHVAVAEAAVVEPLDRVVDVEAVLGAGGALHVPGEERQLQRGGDGLGEQRLAGAGLPLHQEGALERECAVHRGLERRVGQVAVGPGEASEGGGHGHQAGSRDPRSWAIRSSASGWTVCGPSKGMNSTDSPAVVRRSRSASPSE
jgi:hypothetical protein